MTAVGFDKPLYILPFDHRASFQTKLFGWSGALTQDQTAEIAATKQVIYDAFRAALQTGIPEQTAGILVDEQFGGAILRNARARELRSLLMAETIEQLQNARVEPDVWKVEGLNTRKECDDLVGLARRNGSERVGCILLGRGEDDQKVRERLATASEVPGFRGFAVDRTSFWDSLVKWRAKKITRNGAASEIACRYREFVEVFKKKARAA